MNYIDFSQYSTWTKCQWKWYEKYVREFRLKQDGQTDGAFAVGSLFHAGVEEFYKHGNPVIPPVVVEEIQPTPECYNNSMALVLSWIKKSPALEWGENRIFEKPIVFDIGRENIKGLAKLDFAFKLDKGITIPGGIDGQEVYLNPGWWIREYKTRSGDARSRPNWIKSWACDMQADFQMLALREYLKEIKDDTPVVGMLVGVIEKPREYVPKRKCKGCGNQYEFAVYNVLESGLYECGWCKYQQELTPPKKEAGYQGDPLSYYIHVARSEEALDLSFERIRYVADLMMARREGGHDNIKYYGMNYQSCVHPIYGECEFFGAHVSPGYDVEEDNRFVKVESLKYTGVLDESRS